MSNPNCRTTRQRYWTSHHSGQGGTPQRDKNVESFSCSRRCNTPKKVKSRWEIKTTLDPYCPPDRIKGNTNEDKDDEESDWTSANHRRMNPEQCASEAAQCGGKFRNLVDPFEHFFLLG